MKVIILGAGLSGLSTAYHLAKPKRGDLEWATYEKESTVGGLCRSFQQAGFTFDLTGHLLHFNTAYGQRLVQDLLEDNLHRLERKAWIYSFDRYTRYPYQANLFGLPDHINKECLDGFLQTVHHDSRHSIKDLDVDMLSFEQWIISTFGKGIARHFMIPYNRKLWSVEPGEMTCDWMGRYVPRPTVEEVVAGAKSDTPKKYGYNSSFWYPLKGGIQVLSDRLADNAGEIHLNKTATQIDLEKKYITFSDGTVEPYDVLVSSLPLSTLIHQITNAPDGVQQAASGLRHASVLDINIGIDRPRISDKHWVYFPEDKFCFYRVGFPMNFSPHVSPRETSSMYVEVGYDPINGVDVDATVEMAIRQVIQVGLFKGASDIKALHVRPIQFAYCIYDKHRRKAVPFLRDFLNRHDVLTIGRYGAWEYSAMEDALIEGKETANLIKLRSMTTPVV